MPRGSCLCVYPLPLYTDLYRLWSPAEAPSSAWMYVSRDQRKAVVFAFNMGMRHWSDLMPTLRLQGLDPNIEYFVTEPLPNEFTRKEDNLQVVRATEPSYQLRHPRVRLRGAALMKAGIPIQFFASDDAACFTLTDEREVAVTTGSSGDESMPHVGSNLHINNMVGYETISENVTSLTVENVRALEWPSTAAADAGSTTANSPSAACSSACACGTQINTTNRSCCPGQTYLKQVMLGPHSPLPGQQGFLLRCCGGCGFLSCNFCPFGSL